MGFGVSSLVSEGESHSVIPGVGGYPNFVPGDTRYPTFLLPVDNEGSQVWVYSDHQD
jgi:hypothetical protein